MIKHYLLIAMLLCLPLKLDASEEVSEAERVALLIAIYDSSEPASASQKGVVWTTLGKAMETGNGAVLYFDGGPTCKYCKLVDKLWLDADVAKLTERFNMVYCDLEDAKFWGVTEFPSLMVMRPNGQKGPTLTLPHVKEDLVKLLTPKQTQ
jgi:hypothetical protein